MLHYRATALISQIVHCAMRLASATRRERCPSTTTVIRTNVPTSSPALTPSPTPLPTMTTLSATIPTHTSTPTTTTSPNSGSHNGAYDHYTDINDISDSIECGEYHNKCDANGFEFDGINADTQAAFAISMLLLACARLCNADDTHEYRHHLHRISLR
jgi:hypothetical protein